MLLRCGILLVGEMPVAQVVPEAEEEVPRRYVDLIRRLVTVRPRVTGQPPQPLPMTWDDVLSILAECMQELGPSAQQQ